MENGGCIKCTHAANQIQFQCPLLASKSKYLNPKNDEKYGDIFVDTNKSFERFKKWNQWALDKEKHPQNLRRPYGWADL